jgi:hypothetical protein
LNKKVLGAVLTLIAIIAVAAVAPTLAHNKPSVPPAPGTEYVYGKGGYVVLNLPTGALYNKTNIRIGFMDVDKRSTKGAEEILDVRVWVPQLCRYAGIAYINDNPVAVDSITKEFKGVPYLLPILVSPGDLEIWREGDYTVVNLTRPVDAKWGDPAPQMFKDLNFTIPPMTLWFMKTGDVYQKEETNATYPSGWKQMTTTWRAPGWANVLIPSWIGSAIPTAAIMQPKLNIVATPPPAP